jgi:2-phospho-L-lactate guanylyltransferase
MPSCVIFAWRGGAVEAGLGPDTIGAMTIPSIDVRDGTVPHRWRVVVPVKAQHLAKSRLHPPAGVDRSELAHAFALDTLEVAASCVQPRHLVVVTSDRPTRDFAVLRRAVVVDDGGGGLNAAVGSGLQNVLRRLGEGPTAVLLGDLPALRAADLRTALARCGRSRRAFVPDANGTGTVLLTASRAADIVPRFGPGSAAAHEEGGFERLALALPGLRTDVDDNAALRAAEGIGVGRHTAAVLSPPAVRGRRGARP